MIQADPPDCTDVYPPPYWVTCFSNMAEGCLSLVGAPGYDITVGGFEHQLGTSLATPHCSGVAALMFSKNACGSLTAYQARQIIGYTASHHEWGSPDCIAEPQPLHIDAFAAVNAVPGPSCTVAGDLNCDGLVSGYDFPAFAECMSGPGVPYNNVHCTCADFPLGRADGDGDIDLEDVRRFQLSQNGPGSGACCHIDGTCSVTLIYDCLNETGAVYNGHGSTCAQADCVMPRYNNTIDPLTTFTSGGVGLQLADDVTLSGTGGGMLTYYWLLAYGGGGGSFDVTVQLYTACPGAGGTPIAGTDRTFYGNPDGVAVDLDADFSPPVYIPHNVWIVASFSTPEASWFVAEQAEIGYTADYFGRNDPPWQCWYTHQSGGPYCGMWATIDCALVKGACCLPDESCTDGTESECSAVSGVYQGHGTTCTQVNCAEPTGACCALDGSCSQITESECTGLSGTFHPQTTCGVVDCTPERYSNTIAPPYTFAQPYPGYQLADDLTLAGSGPGSLIHYDVLVYRPPDDSYDVSAALHTACPPTAATQIAGTSYSWSGLPAGMNNTLNADFPPVTISGTVWLRLQFSATDAGWIIAGPAEIGSTQDRFGVKVPPWGCDYWFEGDPYAGFWANLTFGGGRAAPTAPVTWVESEFPASPPVRIPPTAP